MDSFYSETQIMLPYTPYQQAPMYVEEQPGTFNVVEGYRESIPDGSPSSSMYPFPGYNPSAHGQEGVFNALERTVSSSSFPQSSPGPDGSVPQPSRRRRMLTPSTDPSSPVEGRTFRHHHQDRPPDIAMSDDDINQWHYSLSQSTGLSSEWEKIRIELTEARDIDLQGLANPMPASQYLQQSSIYIDPTLLDRRTTEPWNPFSAMHDQMDQSLVLQPTSAATVVHYSPEASSPTAAYWNSNVLETSGQDGTYVTPRSPRAKQHRGRRRSDGSASVGSPDSQRRSTGKITKIKTPRRRTGREKGVYHLPEPQREKAKQQREVGSCWRCYFHRKSCSLKHTCEGCIKVRLACDRTQFPELFELPSHAEPARRVKMEKFMSGFDIRPAYGSYDVLMNCGYGPIVPLEGLDELYAKNILAPRETSIQFFVHNGSVAVQKVETESWLLGYRSLDSRESSVSQAVERKWTKFLDDIVNSYWREGFPAYAFQDNPFQVVILQAVVRYSSAGISKKQREACDVAIRYLIAAHTITRVLSLTWGSEPNYSQSHQAGYGTSGCIQSRPLTKQLKYALGNIMIELRTQLLDEMYKKFRTRGTDNWATAMAVFIILATGLELHQTSCQLIADGEYLQGKMNAKHEANQECSVVEDRFDKLIGYFGHCYRSHNNQFNPVFGTLADQHREVLNRPSQDFVDHLRQLMSADYIFQKTQPLVDMPVEEHPARNATRLPGAVFYKIKMQQKPATHGGGGGGGGGGSGSMVDILGTQCETRGWKLDIFADVISIDLSREKDIA
ncbi:MAG: hypothetical protein M1816_003007 [Peltula sp. TS41687]|nr:MAG: hypothetical protein M1816_003007 [Peltula sp. TS41687]